MKIVVIADAALKEELLYQGADTTAELTWQNDPAKVEGASAYIDLLFQPVKERITLLKSLQPATIIVDAVVTTGNALPDDFTRINGWKTFLKRPIVEGYTPATNRDAVQQVFAAFNKTIEWVPDIPGFITARVVSMVINEAWFALEENVSTATEIDTAMKLGTNYPYGPFEWGESIGLRNIDQLLKTLAAEDDRYQPAALLQKKAGA